VADYINNVAAGDKYTDACTLGPDFAMRSAVITIANNPALMQFAVGALGNWHWTDEREFFSIPQSFKVGGVIGLKVRNANPGQVARVLAVLSGPDDVDFEAGLPFSGQISSTGAVTLSAQLAGEVRGVDALPLLGTGFTTIKIGVGNYGIRYVSPSLGVLIPTVTPEGFGIIVEQLVNFSGGFNLLLSTPGGVATDDDFFFTAVAPS
jgi:hypothetical protein